MSGERRTVDNTPIEPHDGKPAGEPRNLPRELPPDTPNTPTGTRKKAPSTDAPSAHPPDETEKGTGA